MEELSAMAFVQILFAHQLHNERLPRGHVHGVHHAQKDRQHHDLPDLNVPGQGEPGQKRRLHKGGGLRAEEHGAPVQPVGHDAAEYGQHKHGKLPGKAHQSKAQA